MIDLKWVIAEHENGSHDRALLYRNVKFNNEFTEWKIVRTEVMDYSAFERMMDERHE